MSPRSFASAARRHLPIVHFAVDSSLWAIAIPLGVFLRYDFAWGVVGRRDVALAVLAAVILQGGFGWTLGLYRRRWRYGSFDELRIVATTALCVGVVMTALWWGWWGDTEGSRAVPRSVPLLATAISVLGQVAIRSIWRSWVEHRNRPNGDAATRLVVVGAGEAAELVLRTLRSSGTGRYLPVAIVDDDPNKRNLRLYGARVEGRVDDIVSVAAAHRASTVLIATPSAPTDFFRRVTALVDGADLEVLTLPPVEELLGVVSVGDIRPVSALDLLGRRQADIDPAAVAAYVTGRRVLVTGAGGSIGSELCRQLVQFEPSTLLMLDRDESGLHATQLSIEGRAMLDDPNLLLADIRDARRIDELFELHRPDVVFHAAALKHLPLLEMHPTEAWLTNVAGTGHLLDAARRHGVARFVNISTDKAASPTSVLGWTKRITERMTSQASVDSDMECVSVRFGNVLGSSGSVLTAFAAQAASGGPITVTHPDVTRYFMTIEEASRLTVYAGAIGDPGEVLILDMGEPVRIVDVAQRFAHQQQPPLEVVFTGLRPNEKLHEVLIGADEIGVRPVHPLITHVSVPPLGTVDLDERVPSFAEMRTLALAPASDSTPRAGRPSGASSVGATVVDSRSTVGRGDGAERIHLSAPDVGAAEREALLRAFDSGWIAPVGTELDAFEDDLGALVGWPGVVALSSGTASLHLALLAAGVGPGDDVIVSSFTFAATANAVTYVGAMPVFVDSDTTSWNMSPALLAEELEARASIGRLPAAVVVVDLYGQCADYDEIVPLCERYSIPVIEDAAEALAATYKGRAAGTLGHAGVFSFNGNKIMTTSGGGAFVSPDAGLADRVRYLSTQAREPALHYEHTEIGFNYRLSNLLAALGRAQLQRLPDMVARRLAIHDRYREVLGPLDGVSFMPQAPWGGWNGWLTCVEFDDPARRDRVVSALDQANIESRPLWKPLHLEPVFSSAPARVDGTSEHLFHHGICLPSSSSLTDSEVERVTDVVIATC